MVTTGLFLLHGICLAQEPTPSDDEVNAIAKQLYCPVCENIPLEECGTKACEQWRGVIRDKLSEGWTEKEIKAYFVEQYGDRVLAEPPKRGLNWLVYIVPPIVFLGGVYVLYRGFKNWRTGDEELPVGNNDLAVSPDPDDEYISKVEQELRNR
jgi:cytochrome c-type biogenesis protein CcmH